LITKKWLCVVAAGIFVLPGGAALADGHGNGRGHDNGHDNGHYRDKKKDHDDDEDRRGYGFASHDRDEIRVWYSENYRHLPPGLAKRDRLPPGLERQLVIRGTLPPGLEREAYPVPVDLERRLPPPPPDCERLWIGGHIVLMNRRTKVVLDIFHLE
jgi:hypothetical protein